MNPSSSLDQLNKKREKYRARLATALEEDDDPLASYDVFIKWIQDNYPSNIISQSGLLEVLEEATRQFKDDVAYKGDLRYLKLWSLYASHVEDPASVYAYLLANNIGTVYAQMYEDYAGSLERSGRISEAENIYRRGIQQSARPLERLKKRYLEFQKRATAPSQPALPPTAVLWKDAPLDTQALRRNPFKNYSPSESAVMPPPLVRQTLPASAASASSSAPHNRYAPMLAPPAPGKRPEKLRFNLSLLFTDEGIEYSMPEARARSMGLLGKKWGPPPQAEITHRLNDEGSRSTHNFARRGAEPTVTLMTKEALADVFGMYNSPEKSMRFGAVAGSKHAPVRKIEPITPIAPMQLHARGLSNENANASAKTPTFRPFVDENANRKENATPAPPPKFKPFVDAEPPSRLPTFTPDVGRRVLHAKDVATPLAAPRAKTGENAQSFKNNLRLIPEDGKHPVVFTPAGASQQDRPRARPDVFIDEQSGSESDNALHSSTSSSSMRPAVAEAPPAAKFTPFVDSGVPFKVFSRPPAPGEEAPPQRSAFKPYVDGASNAVTPRPALRERVPLHPFVPKMREPEPEPEPENDEEDDSMFDDEQDAYEEVDDTPIAPLDEGEVDSEYDEPNSYQPLGGRFGQFEVMTPITERTFEYTMSTRGGTPNEAPEKVFVHEEDAVEAAELLAAEVRADLHAAAAAEKAEAAVEEGTGALSLQDTVAVASTFDPPNPCNPFDPPIISTLMSLVPLAFNDLRNDKIDLLESLQKFAKKKVRRTSGSSASRVGDGPDLLHIALAGRPFAVIDKLGEGGFGAVFKAKDLSLNQRSADDDDDDRDEDDEDEDANNMVALKVVKPRNLWEFCVLRRVHSALSSDLRRSVISPQALYAFRDESFLILELCNQGTLLDIVNRAGPAGVSQAGACLDELLVVFFAIELMRLIEGLHATGFIHGDFKIDNCLLRLEDVPGPASAWDSVYQPSGEGGWRYKGIKMIDFGRTIDTRLFPRGQRFIAEWPADARDCLEIREGRPWTFQTDYYGLAGVIYCMLYGKYIEAASVVPVSSDEPRRYKLATPFKRYWQADLWTRLFDLLLNARLVHPDGHLPLCDELGELRVEMETWLQANCNRASNSLKGLLKKIGIAVLGGKGG